VFENPDQPAQSGYLPHLGPLIIDEVTKSKGLP
jgi:hypothetical protein